MEPRDSISADIRTMHAANPRFARTPDKAVKSRIEHYPKTLARLFDIAINMANSGQEVLAAPSPSQIAELLQQEAKNCRPQDFPEILDPHTLHVTISSAELAELVPLFQDDLTALQVPSYITVQKLLEHGKEALAATTAETLSHESDKARALIYLIPHFLNQHDSEKAIALFSLLPATVDRRDVLSWLLHHLLSRHQQERALQLADHVKPHDLQEHALQEIALWFAKHGHIDAALALLPRLSDPSVQPYTAALIVSILAGQRKFAKAQTLALDIADIEYRQDACNAIIKKMVALRHIDAAKKYLDSLEGFIDKKESKQIIESAIKVHLQDLKIQNLKKPSPLIRHVLF